MLFSKHHPNCRTTTTSPYAFQARNKTLKEKISAKTNVPSFFLVIFGITRLGIFCGCWVFEWRHAVPKGRSFKYSFWIMSKYKCIALSAHLTPNELGKKIILLKNNYHFGTLWYSPLWWVKVKRLSQRLNITSLV